MSRKIAYFRPRWEGFASGARLRSTTMPSPHLEVELRSECGSVGSPGGGATLQVGLLSEYQGQYITVSERLCARRDIFSHVRFKKMSLQARRLILSPQAS